MHYYNMQSDHILAMSARIRDLEDKLASAELGFDVAWDEVQQSRGRERRLLWTAIGLGVVAAVAITQVGLLAAGR